MTGTGEPSRSLTIDLVDSSSPPGVSSSMISARAPSRCAAEIASWMKSAVAGLMVASMTIRSTVFVARAADARGVESTSRQASAQQQDGDQSAARSRCARRAGHAKLSSSRNTILMSSHTSRLSLGLRSR